MNFTDLHYQDKPLLVCNVWDAKSAQTAEKLGFQALGTSSAAIANLLGYEDGEKMCFKDLCFIINRIRANTSLPLTVDIESGYSCNVSGIVENIKILNDLGVVGINIEDSVFSPDRALMEMNKFSKRLFEIKQSLMKEGIAVFVNVRTDAFLLGLSNPVNEVKTRLGLYQKAGADGIFIPCIESLDDIESIRETTNLPINVMCMPNLPGFEQLKALGVNRVSMGNFLFDHMYSHLEYVLASVIDDQSFKSVF